MMTRLIQMTSDILIPAPANSPEPITMERAARPRLTRTELEELFAIELGRVTLH